MLRRIAAMVYDSLLCFAVFVAASALTLPFTGGKGATEYSLVLTLYFFVIFFLFFGWFWTHGGQTLGMRAWHTKLLTRDGLTITWQRAFFRYLVSLPMWIFWLYVALASTKFSNIPLLEGVPDWVLYALATCWTLIDHLPNNWRDRLTGTYIIHIPN